MQTALSRLSFKYSRAIGEQCTASRTETNNDHIPSWAIIYPPMPQAVDAWDRFGKDRTIVTKLRCQAGGEGGGGRGGWGCPGSPPVLPLPLLGTSWTLRFGCPCQAGSSNREILTSVLYGSKLKYYYPGLRERRQETRVSAQHPALSTQHPAPKNQPATEPGDSQQGGHGQPVSETQRGAMRCHEAVQARAPARARARVVLEATNIGGASEKCSFG